MNPRLIGPDEILGAAHLELENLPENFDTEISVPLLYKNKDCGSLYM